MWLGARGHPHRSADDNTTGEYTYARHSHPMEWYSADPCTSNKSIKRRWNKSIQHVGQTDRPNKGQIAPRCLRWTKKTPVSTAFLLKNALVVRRSTQNNRAFPCCIKWFVMILITYTVIESTKNSIMAPYLRHHDTLTDTSTLPTTCTNRSFSMDDNWKAETKKTHATFVCGGAPNVSKVANMTSSSTSPEKNFKHSRIRIPINTPSTWNTTNNITKDKWGCSDATIG